MRAGEASHPAESLGQVVGPVQIEPTSELQTICRARQVAIGVITTPRHVAQEQTDRLIAAGVVSILNFAPVVLQVPDHATLRQVDLAVELQILGFYERQSSSGPAHAVAAGEVGDAG